MRKVVIITSVVLLLYIVLAFFTGTLVGLQGAKLWILRSALWLLGIIAAAVVVWFFWKKKKQEEAAEFSEEAAAQSDDIERLIRDAESKLAAAQLEKGAKLGHLPAILLIGDTASAKTSTMVHSGLDPELLAGQVYQDSNLVPTRAANLWYAQHAIFVEAAGKTTAEPGAWARIVKRLQPGRLGSAVGRSGTAPRAALVMVEAESLTRPGATEALGSTARTLRSRLGEISQTLGINLPVYVLFTKSDRIPFFGEFVRNLTNEEAAQVFGVTVPLLANRSGVYGEEETARLTGVFEQLFRSLANARPMFLQREHEATKLPGIYEFPREFRKLRPTLVQFLVDLCRPSQLTVGPFLRGFYFSGVRPVVINEMAPTPARSPNKPDREPALGATGVFRYDARSEAAPAAAPAVVGSRKVPQWVFLSHFFHNLLLADRVAMGASGSSTKTSLLRRILLATAAALCLLYAIFLIVSYSKNRALENTVRDAAHGIETTADPGPLKVASLDSLRRLETLRQSLAVLTGFHRNGAPLSYRWGLYTGEELYPHIRRIYFDSFRRVLFGQTQTGLLDTLRGLPLTPGPDYAPTYDTLKAYLITTSNHDKSTHEFLPPVLQNRWSAGKSVDADRLALAQTQFEFYSDELTVENPYSSDNDTAAVEKARKYLRQFEGFERVYAALLANAAKNTQPINFNKKFPGTAETVLDGYDVAGPFTKPGWDFMKNAFKDPTASLKGEAWVLGDQGAAPQAAGANLAKSLATRYYSDFIKQWRAYLRAASVVKYKDIQDAAKKLNTLSGNSSPLLALFSLASTNTAVDDPDVAKAFQPVQAVVPPNSDRFVGGPNQAYMNALLQLETAVEGAAGAQKLDDVVAAPTLKSAADARIVTRQVAQTFRGDPEGHVDATVQKLMEDPITSVEALLRRLGPEELNAKGKELCGQYKRLLAKYPFNPNSSAPQATIPDVNGVFGKPDGALWKFYTESLQKMLPKQGSQYVAAPGAVTLTPAFVTFFNHSAEFSELIYAGGTQDPHISYALKPLPSEGVVGIGLKLDGQMLSYKGGDAAPKQFTWQGSGAHGAEATVNLGGPDLGWSSDEGLWAVFRFFAKAETWQPAGGANNLEWIPRISNNPFKLPNGNPLTVKFQLDMGGGPPVFQKGYLSRFGCVADVAK